MLTDSPLTSFLLSAARVLWPGNTCWKYEPRKYQIEGVDFCLKRLYDAGQKGVGIFADPGLGKTFMTLLVLQRLRELKEVKRALVIAPLATCINTWPYEIQDLGFNFQHDLLHGAGKCKLFDTRQEIDIVNPEGLKWLVETGRRPWDIVICDESTLFKNFTAVRSRALRKLLKKIPRRMILTGTPTPNSYADLFGQIYILDDGDRLGKTLTMFRERFCRNEFVTANVSRWEFREERENDLLELLSDMVIRFDEKDHLNLPPLTFNKIWVELPPKIRRQYDILEREFFVALEEDKVLGATNAGAKYQMLKQLVNGGLYEHTQQGSRKKKDRVTHHIHTTKSDRLAQLHDELNHKPLLVAYQVDHDYERIEESLGRLPAIRSGVSRKRQSEYIQTWNQSKLPMLVVQPQSLSHGVNLQFGGSDVCWFGPTDQPEIYYQFNKRIHRSGQTKPVFIHLILARNTIDEAIISRIEAKGSRQEWLLGALKEYKRKRQTA